MPDEALPPDPNPPDPGGDAAAPAVPDAETTGDVDNPAAKPAKTIKDVPEELQRELLELARRVTESWFVPRTALVKTTQEARNFWKGLQNLRWNPAAQRFDPATTPMATNGQQDTQEEIEPTTLNIFQANGLSLVSALSANAPHGLAMPEDGENPQDVATAKASSKIITRFERVNQIENVLAQELQYAYTDGYCGLFVRYKIDGDRFGWRDMPKTVSRPTTVPDANGNPIQTTVQINVGTERVPNGEEVIDAVGSLELSIPPYGRNQHDFPAMEWQTETPLSLLRAIYSDFIEKLNAGGDVGTGTANATERNARLMLANAPPGYDGRFGQASSPDLLTYKRTWLRKWAFYELDDKITRDKLIALFPNGAYLAHAADTLLDARDECMDDHWTIVPFLPGDGMYREPVGGSLMPVQRAVNNLLDRQLQNDAFGVPPIFHDTSLLSGENYAGTVVKPAKSYPIKLKPGQRLSDVMWSPPPTQLSPASTELRNFLIQITAMLTGVQPALFGAPEEGAGGQTAEGYRQALNQAMGRVGLIYRALKLGHARAYECLLRIMAKERKEGIIIPTEGDDGSFRNDVISLYDMQGRVKIYADMQEELPVSWGQQKDLADKLMNAQNPVLQGIANYPENLALWKRTLGWPELKIPGEGPQDEQDEETAKLIEDGQPISTDQATGQPLIDQNGQPYQMPTVPIDPMDNHAIHYARGQEWKESAEGRRIRKEQPEAFANAHLHFMAHFQAMQPPPAPVAAAPAPAARR
jgi:hypothetical protein